MDIFELTVPLETNIKNANTQKIKYEHFITDITTRDVSIYPFKIDSKTKKAHLQAGFLKWVLLSFFGRFLG